MRALALFSALLLPLAACDCEGAGITQVTDGGVPQKRCLSDTDCGPRESCNVSLGVCFSRDACGPDRPCSQPNQICEDQDGDGYLDCGYQRCTDDDECAQLECPEGEVPGCTGGGCICGTPCQGGCPGGEGCCLVNNTCLDLPEECMGLTCPPGQFVSVTSTGAWDAQACMFLGESCRCEVLPPLPIGDIGLYSALAHDGRSPILSAYDIDYGDLMFGVAAPDGTVDWTFVDGVPTSTDTITGDVAGPRGGQSAPGRDVGIYTDLAADPNGRPHIAYVDRDGQDLKYAVGTTNGWRVHTVATDGDTGLYASLALDAAGRARVAYLGAREDSGATGQRKSSLRIAVTSTGTPTGPADWVLREVDTVSLLPFGCAEQCRVGEVCRAADLRCVTPDSPPRCQPACESDERCVMGRCSLIDPLPAFRDVPRARGLWPSLAVLRDGSLLIAYSDRVNLSLKIARVAGPNPASGAITTTTLEGDGVDNDDDTGLYPSLVVTPAGEIHVAYVNATRRRLMYRNLDANLATLAAEVVEDGLDPMFGPDGHYIGADPAMVVDAQGVVRIAYQDGTTGELRYARRQPGGGWVRATLRGAEMPYEGTFGFYTDQIAQPELLISTYRYLLAGPNMTPANGVVLVTPP